MNSEEKKQALEAEILEEPVMEYAWLRTEDIEFQERVRYICQTECPRYNSSWSCPPAVGTVEECRERVLQFTDCFVFSTIAEVNDITNMEETLKTRASHEEITRHANRIVQKYFGSTLTLSTESCDICTECAWPDKPCRHPDLMFPCVESYSILVTDLAKKGGISFSNGQNVITWFSVIFCNTGENPEGTGSN